jgi:hypothetical protein
MGKGSILTDRIRKLFAATYAARARHYGAGLLASLVQFSHQFLDCRFAHVGGVLVNHGFGFRTQLGKLGR